MSQNELERIDTHDQRCAEAFDQLAGLGCFDEEFLCYGTAYQGDNRRHYLISSKAKNVYQFVEAGYSRGLYCLPVVKHLSRCQVPSGQKSTLAQGIKIELAQYLQKTYEPQLLDELRVLGAFQAVNTAKGILNAVQNQLAGSFDLDALGLFQRLVQYAFEAKKIDPGTYSDFRTWLKEESKLLANDIISHDIFERTYTGFAYEEKPGQITYYDNAVPELALARKTRLTTQGIFTTPVFTKRYCFRDVSLLAPVTAHYRHELKHRLDQYYLTILQAIHALPNTLDRAKYQAVAEQCDPAASKVMAYYAMLWHL